MSLLEQDTIKKVWVGEKVSELDISNKNNKVYKIEVIWDSTIYANTSKSDYLPDLDYLVA